MTCEYNERSQIQDANDTISYALHFCCESRGKNANKMVANRRPHKNCVRLMLVLRADWKGLFLVDD